MSSEPTGILIPAYGAASTVAGIVRSALPLGDDLLVVDDGSRDDTGAVARSAGARVIRHHVNRGKGAALATGFADLVERGVSAVITLDADGQHEPREIPRLVSAWRERDLDLIVGARLGGFSGMSPLRRFGNRFSSGAVRLFGGPDLPDTQCGLRLYSRRFLERVAFRRRAYDAEAEMLMLAARHGMQVASVPIRVPEPDGRATSHYRPWLDTYRMCRTVVICSLAGRRAVRPAGPAARSIPSRAPRA